MTNSSKFAWPATLDPKLVTWTQRDPKRVLWAPRNGCWPVGCASCGTPFGYDDAQFIVWRGNGDGARFCTACTERHWGMRMPPEVHASGTIVPELALAAWREVQDD
jgi:hypothetical protein